MEEEGGAGGGARVGRCSRLGRAHALALASDTHARLGQDCALRLLPSSLVLRLVEACRSLQLSSRRQVTQMFCAGGLREIRTPALHI